jgi:predicted PurR-regulated permease PerM
MGLMKRAKNGKRALAASRILAVTATQVLVIGLVTGLLVLILPQIYYSVVHLVENSQTYYKAVSDWISRLLDGDEVMQETAQRWADTISRHLTEYLTTSLLPRLTDIITSITGGVYSIFKGLFNMIVGDIISIYLLYNREMFSAQSKKILYSLARPQRANRILDEMSFVNRALGSYVVGNLIDALIIGAANYIFLLCTRVPYAALTSIVMAVFNLIPIFGPVIGAVPCAFLILLESPSKALVFIIFTLVSQQLDANVLKPRIHSSRSGISGFWIMFAILFFGGLFGLWGMLLGVPLLTVIYDALRRLNTKSLKSKGLPTDTEEYKNIYRIDPVSNSPVYEVSPEGPEDGGGDTPE